jgi:ribosome-associated protein
MLVNRKPNKSVRLAKNSKIIKAIIQAIQEKKGEKIISLDLRKIQEAVADFFIVCEAGSTTQVRAIADFIEMELKEKCGEIPYMHEGRQVLQWVIIDYVNVVVHIMLPESRRFYKLEEMWSDAALEEHEG